ncbi:hypothetical protein Tco_1362270 [Tanacetum coccineum]
MSPSGFCRMDYMLDNPDHCFDQGNGVGYLREAGISLSPKGVRVGEEVEQVDINSEWNCHSRDLPEVGRVPVHFVEQEGCTWSFVPRVLALLLQELELGVLICNTASGVIPFKSSLGQICHLIIQFVCFDLHALTLVLEVILHVSHDSIISLDVVVKIVLGDTVCLRNGGLISWRLINLGSMKLILTEIGLVKISTSVVVEIALPVLVKVIPPIEIVSIISLRVLNGWKNLEVSYDLQHLRSGAGARSLVLWSKSNARTISLSSATSGETAWVGRRGFFSSHIRAAPSIENGKSYAYIVAIGTYGDPHCGGELVEVNGYELAGIKRLRPVPSVGAWSQYGAIVRVVAIGSREDLPEWVILYVEVR